MAVRGAPQSRAKCLLSLIVVFTLASAGRAERPVINPKRDSDLAELETIYIPQSELAAAMQRDNLSAVLSKAEFEKLLQKARAQEDSPQPRNHAPVVTSAAYECRIAGERLIAQVSIHITSQNPHAETSLSIAGWNVESGTLKNEPARLARSENNADQLRVFLPEAGTHQLQLQLSLPLKSAGSDQLATLGLVGAAAEELRVTLPEGKFLRVDGGILSRPENKDGAATYSIPVGGRQQVQLTVTDREHASQADVLTFASTAFGVRVLASEVTLRSLTDLQVFGRTIDRLTCRVPNTLEITQVESPGLESWELSDDPAEPMSTRLTLTWRAAFAGHRQIRLWGILSEPAGEPWRVPNLVISDVTAHSGVVIVRHPAGMRVQVIEQSGARPVVTVPAAAQQLFTQTAQQFYEIWEEDFTLRLQTALKVGEVQAAMTNVLSLTDAGQDLSATITWQTRQAAQFDARIRLPSAYQVTAVTRDGQAADWTLFSSEAGVNEVRVPFEPALQPGQSTTIAVTAHFDPENWPPDQSPQRFPLPEVQLPQAGIVEGIYAILSNEDFRVAPVEITGLDPAGQQDTAQLKQRLQPNDQTRQLLVFNYQDTVFSGQVEVARRPPQLSVETITYLRLERESVFAQLEALLSAQGGGVPTLTVLVSESAGDRLRFSLLPQNGSAAAHIMEQTAGDVTDGLRAWTLKLNRPLKGGHVLLTTVRQPRPDEEAVSPPVMRFPQAESQSGYLAVEGPGDEHLEIEAQTSDGSPLSAVDPVDFPKGRYRPRDRVVAGYQYFQPGWSLTVSSQHFEHAAVPTAIGHWAEVRSVWGESGRMQHEAQFLFSAVGTQNLLIELPEQTQLWSVMIDGHPIEARQTEQTIRVPLASLKADQKHRLVILYESMAPPIAGQGTVQAVPPQVAAVAGDGTQQPLEILQRRWKFYYPPDTLLVDTDGRFQPETELDATVWLGRIWQKLKHPEDRHLFQAGTILLCVTLGLLIFGLLWRRLAPAGLARALVGMMAIGVIVVAGVSIYMTFSFDFLTSAFRPAREAATGVAATAPAAFELTPTGELSDANIASPQARPPSPEWSLSTTPNQSPQPFGAQLGDTLDDALQRQPSTEEASPPFEFEAAADKDLLSGEMLPQLQGTIVQQETAPQSGGMGGMVLGKDGVEGADANAAAAPAGFFSRAEGLLSMNVSLQVPADDHEQQFTYHGNAPSDQADLQIAYANRTTGQLLVCCIALGIGLLGWWLRRAPMAVRLVWVFLTIFLPIAVFGLVPALWHIACEGLLLGGILSLCGWLLAILVRCCRACCSWKRTQAAALLLAGSSLALTAGTAEAEKMILPQEPDRPHVIVPYTSLDEVEQADRVWIPADVFKRLWQAVHPEDAGPPAASVPFAVAEATYVARLADDEQAEDEDPTAAHVLVQARWVMLNLSDSAQQVPIPIQHAGLQKVERDGSPVTVTVDSEGRGSVLLDHPGVSIIDAEFVIPATVTRLTGHFSLQTQPVAAGTLTFVLPKQENGEMSVRVNGSSGLFQLLSDNGATRVQVPVDRGGELTIAWQPDRQQADVREYVQLDANVAAVLSDTGLELNHDLQLHVRQGSRQDVAFELPPQMSLRTVSGPDVGGWQISSEGESRRLKILFSREITDSTRFAVALFRPWTITETTTVPVSLLHAPELGRQSGQLAFFVPDQLRVQYQNEEHLRQTDATQFSTQRKSDSTSGTPRRAYRFAEPPRLTIQVSRDAPTVQVTAEHGLWVQRRKVTVASHLSLDFTGTPQRLIDIKLPANMLPTEVVCELAEDWYLTGQADQQRLRIELQKPYSGRLTVGLKGNLPRPADQQTLSLNVPYVVDADRTTTTVGIWFDGAESVSIQDANSWRSRAPDQLPARIRNLRGQPVDFAFQSSSPSGAIVFRVRKSQPQLTADAATLMAVGDATVEYGFTFRWNIAAAPADTFILTGPDWLGELEFNGNGIRQVRRESLDNDRARWTISLIEPVAQEYMLTASSTVSFAADQIVRTPLLDFQKRPDQGEYQSLQTQRQFAVLVNLSRGHLTASGHDAEAISADDVPLKLPEELVRQAMEIVRVRPEQVPQWTLQRPESRTGNRAIVVTATLKTILAMDGSWRTEAIYGVRNRGQQFLAIRLPEKSRLLSVFVRGQPSRTVIATRDDQKLHLVALPQTSEADLSFDIRLLTAGRFASSLPDQLAEFGREFTVPVPQILGRSESEEFGVPVAQTLWSVFVPEEVTAVPVDDAVTNVTYHRQDAWLASEMLALQRMKSDLSEMKRIATDASASESQRSYARGNLKQLEGMLRKQQQSFSGKKADSNELSVVISQNQMLLREAEEVPQAQFGEPAASNGAFIERFNSEVLQSNSAAGSRWGRDSATPKPEVDFFFDDVQGRRKAGTAGDVVMPQRERALLREQLRNQAPVTQQQAQESKAAAPNGRFGLPELQGRAEGELLSIQDQKLAEDAEQFADDGEMDGFAQPAWTATGGLSLEMRFPAPGKLMSFSKVGGDPRLVLAIRPESAWSTGVAAVWCVVVLAAGIVFTRCCSGRLTVRRVLQLIAAVCVIVGTIGFLTLAGPVRWGMLGSFIFGGLVWIVATTFRRPEVA